MDGHLYGDKTSQSRCSAALGCSKSVQLKPTAEEWQVQGSPVYLPWGCVLAKPDEENLGVINCWLLKTRERINCEKEITLDGCFCIIISVYIFLVFDFHLFSFYGYYRSNNYFSCARVPHRDRGVLGQGCFQGNSKKRYGYKCLWSRPSASSTTESNISEITIHITITTSHTMSFVRASQPEISRSRKQF